MSRTRYIENLGGGADDPELLGGKGASLCRLVSMGHRVPPGFVITRLAFADALQELGLASNLGALASRLADAEDAIDVGAKIQERILGGRIPKTVLNAIEETIKSLGLWEGPSAGVILRSSATIEDGSAHSFAGIFESIPISAPEKLEPTLREIWASVFSPRALSYFREIGVREMPAMAVVVQRFLPAERSGVMFTRFAGPDGRPSILVEHVEGDCEKLVKGEITPDRLWLHHQEEIPETIDGPLPASHARSLAEVARKLEESFGGPQDVEWVIHDGVIHVVQSRPITAAFLGEVPTTPESTDESAPILTGVPASSGLGSGPVHLVFNIDQALQLETGSVLVTPMTNPDMVVAMRRSAAIVTDVGGIICHAAIVSRELGLPCVVGTESATTSLATADPISVNGSTGKIYRGNLKAKTAAESSGPIQWSDLWSAWTATSKDRPEIRPVISSAEALQTMPAGISEAVLLADPDLRTTDQGLWYDLEALSLSRRQAALDDYLQRVTRMIEGRPAFKLHLSSLGSLSRQELSAAIERAGHPAIMLYDPAQAQFPLALSPELKWPAGPAAVPLATALRARGTEGRNPQPLAGMATAEAAALDTIKFFGHKPGSKFASMPLPLARAKWWAVLPEYGRFHQEFQTAGTTGEFEWLEVRPELVISALLKSLVQPGFEMVPRVLGFRNVPPLHIKWIKCRYHFRSDTFALIWQSIVRATWNEEFMTDMMRRVRESYDRLAEVLVLFPKTDAELAVLSGNQIVALITSWWPRWVEFFALCWFIQAQGDDILFPFIEETVGHHLEELGSLPGNPTLPGPADFIAPTTPVMSASYMADVASLREALLASGLTTVKKAEAALDIKEQPAIAQKLQEHLAKWHWMRDRDLLFEPWDTRRRVIETALKTETHAVVPYEENLQRNLLALSLHFDLAHQSGRALGLNHAARFLHDLNVERENHHVLWLKYSYPLRRLAVEIERRLIEAGSLENGEIFFLQAPELIEAARNLPAGLPEELIAKVKNRRRGYLIEARLIDAEGEPASDEDDYY